MTIGEFRKHTELSRSTSLGEYRVSNLYFFPQEGERLEFIIGLGFAKGRLRLILGRWTIVKDECKLHKLTTINKLTRDS